MRRVFVTDRRPWTLWEAFFQGFGASLCAVIGTILLTVILTPVVFAVLAPLRPSLWLASLLLAGAGVVNVIALVGVCYPFLSSPARVLAFSLGFGLLPLLLSTGGVMPGGLIGAATVAVVLSAWTLVRLFYGRPVHDDGTHCVYCGYNLTANVSGRCPECGAAVAAPE